MSRKALAKNVDPAVTGLLEAVEKDLIGSMAEYKALFAEQKRPQAKWQRILPRCKNTQTLQKAASQQSK